MHFAQSRQSLRAGCVVVRVYPSNRFPAGLMGPPSSGRFTLCRPSESGATPSCAFRPISIIFPPDPTPPSPWCALAAPHRNSVLGGGPGESPAGVPWEGLEVYLPPVFTRSAMYTRTLKKMRNPKRTATSNTGPLGSTNIPSAAWLFITTLHAGSVAGSAGL